MKNTGLLCLLSLGLLIPLKAQIVITNAVFPATGDTLFYAIDNQPSGIVMTAPGFNQQWDFSNLQASSTQQQIFQDASTGTVFSSFPSADLVYQTNTANVEAYLNVSAQKVELLGYSGGSIAALGLPLIPKYAPPVAQSRAPVQIFDINQVSSGLLLAFDPHIFPGVEQLPVVPDSMRLRIALNRLDVVDAYGTLAIPGGTFDVLREKRTEYTETRLDAKVFPLGWLDITDIATQALNLTTLGVDTTVTFYFLNDVSKEAIAVCRTDNSGLLVVNVQYKNLDATTGVRIPERAAADLTVFPNPAEEVLQIRAGNLDSGVYTVCIYNTLGQEVLRKTCTVASGQLEDLLDIASLEKGVYTCKISNSSGHTGQAKFVKQ